MKRGGTGAPEAGFSGAISSQASLSAEAALDILERIEVVHSGVGTHLALDYMRLVEFEGPTGRRAKAVPRRRRGCQWNGADSD